MRKNFKIIDYYTGEDLFTFTFETYQMAMRYWKVYSRNDKMGRLIIIR